MDVRDVPCADEFAALWEYRIRDVADGVIETISKQYGKKIGKACEANKERLIAYALKEMIKKYESSPTGQ